MNSGARPATPPSVGEEVNSAAASLLSLLEEDLAHPVGRLKFTGPVERRFQQARDVHRRRHFLGVGLAGFLSFDLFLIADRLIMPDIFTFVRDMSLWGVTPLGLLVLGLIYRRKLPPEIVIVN